MNWNEFCHAAYSLGFSGVGICSPESFDNARRQILSEPEIAERKQLRFCPKEDEPWVKGLAVLLWKYRPYDVKDPGEIFVDSYYKASNAAYHAAAELARLAGLAGRQIKSNVSYPAREAAIRAGLGLIGRNGMLITKAHGSRVVIMLMATDYEPADTSNTAIAQACLDCGRCVRACPAGALDERGMSHPERCMRNFMMEGIAMPNELREKNGMRLLGCDICQRVCPMQPNATEESPERFFLREYLTDDERQFSSAVQRLASVIGRNTARPQRIRAQAALLAGIDGNPDNLPVLRQWAKSPFEAVNTHAQWAINRIESMKQEE